MRRRILWAVPSASDGVKAKAEMDRHSREAAAAIKKQKETEVKLKKAEVALAALQASIC
jgi:hypothetical protein